MLFKISLGFCIQLICKVEFPMKNSENTWDAEIEEPGIVSEKRLAYMRCRIRGVFQVLVQDAQH